MIAAAANLLAVGTTSGMVVLHTGGGLAAAAASPDQPPSGAAGTTDSLQSANDPVSALAFSHSPSPSDPLWLLVGHSSGAVTVWDLLRRPARQVAVIAQHGLPIVHASFFPGRRAAVGIPCMSFFAHPTFKACVVTTARRGAQQDNMSAGRWSDLVAYAAYQRLKKARSLILASFFQRQGGVLRVNS